MQNSNPNVSPDEYSSRVKNFYSAFRLFLSVDAVCSLTGKGRDRKIILEFYKFLYTLPLNKINNIDYFSKAQLNLYSLLIPYVKNYENYKIQSILTNDYNQPFLDYINEFQQDETNPNLGESFTYFTNAIKLYKMHKNNLNQEDLKTIYIRNTLTYYDRNVFPNEEREEFNKTLQMLLTKNNIQFANETMLKQSLMEFFNAISHFNETTYKSLSDLDDLEQEKNHNNIKRAMTHLTRGTLDFYKAIIKELTLLNKVDNTFVNTLKTIRENEYNKIGYCNANRLSLIQDYCNLLKQYFKI